MTESKPKEVTTEYVLCCDEMNGTVECNHIFFRDRNPSNCLNCGKTEEQLIIEGHEEAKLAHELLSSRSQESHKGESWRRGYEACSSELAKKIEGMKFKLSENPKLTGYNKQMRDEGRMEAIDDVLKIMNQ